MDGMKYAIENTANWKLKHAKLGKTIKYFYHGKNSRLFYKNAYFIARMTRFSGKSDKSFLRGERQINILAKGAAVVRPYLHMAKGCLFQLVSWSEDLC